MFLGGQSIFYRPWYITRLPARQLFNFSCHVRVFISFFRIATNVVRSVAYTKNNYPSTLIQQANDVWIRGAVLFAVVFKPFIVKLIALLYKIRVFLYKLSVSIKLNISCNIVQHVGPEVAINSVQWIKE